MRTNIRISSVKRNANQLSGGQRQAIAVARAMAWGSRLILMDEPTGALGVEQQETVAQLIRSAAAGGTAVLLISHNLPQVHDLCKRLFVLYHGQLIATLRAEDTTMEETISWITGAALRRPAAEVHPHAG